MKTYVVRILVDNFNIYHYEFDAPARHSEKYLHGTTNRDLILLGAGVLFINDWCPSSPWCVFDGDACVEWGEDDGTKPSYYETDNDLLITGDAEETWPNAHKWGKQ